MAESDADKIRNKRLAKLGGSSTPQPPRDEQSPPAPASATPSQSPSATAVPAAAPSSTKPIAEQSSSGDGRTTGAARSGVRSTAASGPSSAPKINISSSKDTPHQNGSARPRSHSRQQRTGKELSLEEWEDRMLGDVFKVTLKQDAKQDAHGRALLFLSSLAGDLSDEGRPLLLNIDGLDQAITEAGTLVAKTREDPFDYLLACWKRICRIIRGMRSTGPDNSRYVIAKEARRLCMSYCMFACTMPEMFDAQPKATNPLTDHLLAEPESEGGIDLDFLTEFTSRFDDDESYKDLMVSAVEGLSSQLSAMSLNDYYKPYMVALRNLVRYPKIVHAITESDKFLRQGSGTPDIERHTTLGPFFRLSPLQPECAKTYFPTPKTSDRGAIQNAQRSLRLTLQTHQAELFDVVNIIVKTAKEPREKILDWFALVVNSNHKRRAMQVDPATISTDGFMLNITTILDQLCEPFIDASFSKIDRIDPNYLRRHPRVHIRDETKINADQKMSDEFYDQKVEGENNFISELFFLTVAAHHYGTEAVNSHLSKLKKNIKYHEQDLARLEGERARYASQPRYAIIFEQRLQKFKDEIDLQHALIHCTEGALLDELVQARSMGFMRYVILFQLRLASGQNLPKMQLSLPLPDTIPDAFRCLPEYFLEDIVDNFKFITKNMPWIFTTTQSEEIVKICVTFLRSSNYIKSPYLKSGLVSILFYGVWAFHNNSRGVLGDLLNGLEFCHKHLLHALMNFYIECESTGSHTQFYDKFNIRYEIDAVIKCIWPNVIYRENLAKEATTNTEFFVRFVNLLLNDVTFVLDESFTSFHKIHDLTKELREDAASMDENIRKGKEEQLEEHKGKAKSYMGLTTETISMLKLFTEALSTSFTMPEVVQRLADMLDYNVDALVGPKQSNLKVERPDEYGFNPQQLLADLLDVYLNLRRKDSFALAVAKDGRSYKPVNFAKVTELMERFGLKSKDELLQWSVLQKAIAEAAAADAQAEEDLGEIPDELQDPIMGSLMVDPVILPSSKQIVDRSTIRSHLLSDPTDPFNRVPLKIEEVLDAVEKKQEILAFIASKKAKPEAMDTSIG